MIERERGSEGGSEREREDDDDDDAAGGKWLLHPRAHPKPYEGGQRKTRK